MTNYCTAAEVKSQIQRSSSASDTFLDNVIIPAVSQAIDHFCNWPDGFVAPDAASARVYPGSGTTVQWMDPCVQVTKVEVKDSPTDTAYVEWDTDTWLAATGDPARPDFNRTPYTFLLVTATGSYDIFTSGQFTHRRGFRPYKNFKRSVPTVRITSRWGYAATTPPLVKEATIVQVARILKRGESAFADALAPSDFGTVQFIKRLDPIVEQMLIDGRMVRPAVGRRY